MLIYYSFPCGHLSILAIPDSLFEKIKGENVVKFMKACQEINIAFIPYEMQVWVLFWFEIIIIIFYVI